jgi:hypothetical protein
MNILINRCILFKDNGVKKYLLILFFQIEKHKLPPFLLFFFNF